MVHECERAAGGWGWWCTPTQTGGSWTSAGGCCPAKTEEKERSRPSSCAKGGHGRTEFMLAGGAAAGPSPHGREQAWQRRGKCPRARPGRIVGFGIAHTGHPSSHALPSGRGLELIYAAHPEATQVAGRRCRVRARSWAVRGTHDSFEGRRNHTCSAVLAVVSYTTSSCSQCTAARLSTPVRARGRGERVRGTARQRAVACGASAHTRPSANPNHGVQAWRVDGASGRTWQCLPHTTATAGGKTADVRQKIMQGVER